MKKWEAHMFAINNMKTFKDSVHGYIHIPKSFVDSLIDNEYFQRLRNIDQTGMRVLYPNGKHDRFSHSLGVFHLGQRAVDALLENFSKDQYWHIESDSQSVLYWAKNKVLFLIACLLHDIGHAPFSHALEEQLLRNSKAPSTNKKTKKKKEDTIDDGTDYITKKLCDTIVQSEKAFIKQRYNEDIDDLQINIDKVAPHEQMGALLVLSEFFSEKILEVFDSLHQSGYPRPESESILYAEHYQERIILESIDKNNVESMTIFQDDLCFIARMIMGVKYDDWRPERQIRNCFIDLLNGTNFDVDKLDYIVRDTQMSGISNISVDVDRLLTSLCIITKTKYYNKSNLTNKRLESMTIVHIENQANDNKLCLKGQLKGQLIIEKNTTVTIKESSKIKALEGLERRPALIKFANASVAEFDYEATVYEDSEIIVPEENEAEQKVILLRGKSGNKPFGCRIKNATVLKQFRFIACEDLVLSVHESCDIIIEGAFSSKGSIRLFKVEELSGNISEIEILGDGFKQDFTLVKIPGKNGYNTFSIGFKKQAVNLIANVIDARNYLYLWVYAHHKVIYYANFLIPVISNEYFSGVSNDFPNWALDFDHIKYLDDYYFWTAVKYCAEKNTKRKKSELNILTKELFTRKYKKSLYKSLAEFDLFFEKYDETIKSKLPEQIYTLLNDTKKRPYIKSKKVNKKQRYVAGYFKKTEVDKINDKIKKVLEKYFKEDDIPSVYNDLCIEELVYVSADYKSKQLDTLNTFIDMKDDIVPISQIQLLEAQSRKSENNLTKTYFYLYYQTKHSEQNFDRENEFIKEAVKDYFEDIVKTITK